MILLQLPSISAFPLFPNGSYTEFQDVLSSFSISEQASRRDYLLNVMFNLPHFEIGGA